VLLGLGAVQKAPCVDDHMSGQRYATRLCYSDIPSFYPERGLHLGFAAFGGQDDRYPPLEYPPLTVAYIEASRG